jgi:hypothetical protein
MLHPTMKHIVSVSLGPANADYEFTTRFLGQQFHIRRFGADGDVSRAAALLGRYQGEADACGLGMVRDHAIVGTRQFVDRLTARLEQAVTRVPVTTGARLRTFVDEWAVRHVHNEEGGYFTNARVLFLSGIGNYRMASTLSEYTRNLRFADPMTLDGLPTLLRARTLRRLVGPHQAEAIRCGCLRRPAAPGLDASRDAQGDDVGPFPRRVLSRGRTVQRGGTPAESRAHLVHHGRVVEAPGRQGRPRRHRSDAATAGSAGGPERHRRDDPGLAREARRPDVRR